MFCSARFISHYNIIGKKGSIKMQQIAPVTDAKEFIIGLNSRVLRDMSKHREKTTEYGSPSFITKMRSRGADFTRNIVDGEVTEKDYQTIEEVKQYLKSQVLVQVDREMCQGGKHRSFLCRLYVTKPYSYLALMLYNSLLRPLKYKDPDFYVIDVPEWKERAVIVDPINGVTYVLGSDYYGEIKKGFLRMTMYRAKIRGMIGLHAGSKDVWAVSRRSDELIRSGMLFFGLSGTGKTSLTCHDFNMDTKRGEKIVVRQDDVVILSQDGYCTGTEGKGFYVKTEDLSPDDQKSIYYATISQNAILENVWVGDDGKVDFTNKSLASNGRAIVQISEVENSGGGIDLPFTNQMFFITRNALMPPVTKLTPAQAACTFMLGESIKTSAADPNAKGEAVREVGTNPFIIGPKYEEGDRIYEILQDNPNMDCYILNTGYVGIGEKKIKIGILDTVAIIREIAREGIEWVEDELLQLQVPKSVVGFDINKYDVRKYFSQTELEERLKVLRKERMEWLEQFPGLYKEIVSAVY